MPPRAISGGGLTTPSVARARRTASTRTATTSRGLEGYGSGLAEYNDYLYYTTTGFWEGPANIGRVKNDGSGLNNAYITGCSTPSGVYVDGRSAATSVAALAARSTRPERRRAASRRW